LKLTQNPILTNFMGIVSRIQNRVIPKAVNPTMSPNFGGDDVETGEP
jgi:hypothetical protein